MPKSGTTKTVVLCRPGLLQQMQSAFAGMEIRVVDDLDVDYKFDQEELTGMDLVMAELEQEERVAADPKHAHTFIVPMLPEVKGFEDLVDCSWLTIRTEDNVSRHTVEAAIQKVKIVTDFLGDDVDVTATISELRQALKDEGVNVLSISEADGITRLS